MNNTIAVLMAVCKRFSQVFAIRAVRVLKNERHTLYLLPVDIHFPSAFLTFAASSRGADLSSARCCKSPTV